MPARRVPISVRLEKYVVKTDTCWLWTGALSTGYGRMRVLGRDVWAHRAAWELANKTAVPDGMMVCHRCDVKNCVRPDHLFIGSAADNKHDAMQKGRHAYGQRHPGAKLSAEKIALAREWIAGGVNWCEIARRLGVTRMAIKMAIRGKTWKHVA